MVTKCIEPLAKPGRGNVLVARVAANRGRRGRRPSHALGFASTSIAMGILHFLFAICRGIVYSVGVCRFFRDRMGGHDGFVPQAGPEKLRNSDFQKEAIRRRAIV